MPRLMVIVTGLATGGAQTVLEQLVGGGLARRFALDVVSLTGEGVVGPRLRDRGVALHTLDMRAAPAALRAPGRLWRLVRQIRPDIVQGWMYHGNLAANVAALGARGAPPVCWNIRHSLHDPAREKRATRWVIRANRWRSRRPAAIVYNSEVARRQHEAFGFHPGGSRTIANGFDLERLYPDADDREAVRAELEIPAAAPLVGHVARMHPMKDHAAFLRAAVRIARDHADVHFLLVGRGIDWTNATLAALVPQALRPRFRLLGERHDCARLLRAMDLLVSSSAWGEAFPNVLGEAMATGVPCIATDVGDSAAVVGDTGFVVAPREEDALTRAITGFLARSAAERRNLGQAARARIQARYSLPAVVADYAQMYDSLLAAPAGRA